MLVFSAVSESFGPLSQRSDRTTMATGSVCHFRALFTIATVKSTAGWTTLRSTSLTAPSRTAGGSHWREEGSKYVVHTFKTFLSAALSAPPRRSISRSMVDDYRVPPYFSEDLFRLVGERRRPPYR